MVVTPRDDPLRGMDPAKALGVGFAQRKTVFAEPQKITARHPCPDAARMIIVRPLIGRIAGLEDAAQQLSGLQRHFHDVFITLHARGFDGILTEHKNVHKPPSSPYVTLFIVWHKKHMPKKLLKTHKPSVTDHGAPASLQDWHSVCAL